MPVFQSRALRGAMDHGWLKTWHTFSFGDWHRPDRMGFHALRVINEDIVAPSSGFGTHPHRDMEIVTWVLSGELTHRDSMGHEATLRPGDVQRMTAGTGVLHSEWNAHPETPCHLYQIWIRPDRAGHPPAYDDRSMPAEGRRDRWQVLVSPDGRDGSLDIRRDVAVSVADLTGAMPLGIEVARGRVGWLQVTEGALRLEDGQKLEAGDAVELHDSGRFSMTPVGRAQALYFDLD